MASSLTEASLVRRHPPLARNRDFLLLWSGQGVSQIGAKVLQIGLVWWAMEQGGSLAAVSWALVATSLPFVIVGLFAGVLADKFDRRALMVACEAGNGLIVMLLAYLAWTQLLTLPMLMAGTALVSTLAAVFSPAAMAAIPDLVDEPDLIRANSLQEMTAQGALVFGPAIGGALLAMLGTPAAFLATAVTYTLSSLCMLALRLKRHPAPPADVGETPAPASPWSEMVGGFAVLKENPAIATLLGLFAVANFLLVPVTVFLPYYAKDVFAVGAGGLGVLEGSIGVGMILGALALMRTGSVKNRRLAIQYGLAIPGLALLLMGTWASYPVFIGALLVLGGALSVMNVVSMTFFQENVPPERLGRFMGLLMTLIMALMPLSYGSAGLATVGVPAGAIMAVGGVLLLILGVALPLMRTLQPLKEANAHG
ncbi:putative bacilysin exporter BacE [compost metagenome]